MPAASPSPSPAAAAPLAAGRAPLRVGVVGRRGAATAAGLRAGGARVTALCELDPLALERLGAELEVPPHRRFQRYEDLLACGIDAVVVATPMQLHAPQCVAALEAGKHALSEVTAAVSLPQCRALLGAARRAADEGCVYMLAENYCYSRQNVLVGELARRGAFGTPYYAEGEYLHDVKDLHHGPDGSPTWRARWQVGVNGCTYPTHSLGPILQWLGREPITSVCCLGSGVHTDPEHAIEDSVVLLAKLASGRLARVRLDMMSNRPHAATNYTLQGTAGAYESARAPGEADRIWLARAGSGQDPAQGQRRWRDLREFDAELPAWYRDAAEAAAHSGHGGGDFFTARAFARACLGLEPVPIPVEDALNWTLAGLCSQASIAQGGAPVAVPGPAELEGARSAATAPLCAPPPAVGVPQGPAPLGVAAPPAQPALLATPEHPRGAPSPAPAPRGPQLVMRRPAPLAPPVPEPPPGYALRTATAGDAAALADLLTATFEDWSVERVHRALLAAPDVRATQVLTDAAGRIVACASDRRLPARFGDACYLHFVAAAPAHAGQGLGRAVSAAALAAAAAGGAQGAVLETDDHRLPAVVTYLRLGFVPEYTDASHPARWAAVLAALVGGRPG